MNEMEMPVYEIDVESVDALSLVSNPANEILGMYFNKNQNFEINNKFYFAIEEEQCIISVIMQPNKIMPRDEGKFAVYFTEQGVRNIQKFIAKNPDKVKINIDHTNKILESAYLLEHWIIEDLETDKTKLYNFQGELKKGDLIGKIKIEDKQDFDTFVKNGGRIGISPEVQAKNFNYKGIQKVKFEKESVCTCNGCTCNTKKENFAKPINIFEIGLPPLHDNCKCQISKNGNSWLLENGACNFCRAMASYWADFKNDSGNTPTKTYNFSVTEKINGVLYKYKKEFTKMNLKFNKIKGISFAVAELKNGKSVNIIGEGKVGDEVYVLDESGNESAAPDGTHELLDGTLIETVGGKIVSIKEVETEEKVEMEKKEDVNLETEKKVEMKDEKKVEMEEDTLKKEVELQDTLTPEMVTNMVNEILQPQLKAFEDLLNDLTRKVEEINTSEKQNFSKETVKENENELKEKRKKLDVNYFSNVKFV